jgi:hypothetical protein
VNPPGQQQVQVPVTKQILFQGCAIEVGKLEGGGRQLQIVDPASGTVYLFPLSPEAARKIGNDLFSAVPIARAGEVPK